MNSCSKCTFQGEGNYCANCGASYATGKPAKGRSGCLLALLIAGGLALVAIPFVGIVAASLLMPGGEPRQVFGEAGLRKVLETSFYADGGNISRSPQAQLDAIMALSMLAKIYDMRRI